MEDGRGDETAVATVEDRRLHARLLAGDEDAFRRFVALYGPVLLRYAVTRLPGDPDRAAEVVQTVLCRAVEGLARYRGEGPLGAWLVGICRFELSRHRRRAWRETLFAVPDPAVPDPAEGAQAELERRERAGRVHATLEALQPPYGEALEWKYVDGLPVREIAARLGVSAKAAESLLGRARAAFRRLYDDVARTTRRRP